MVWSKDDLMEDNTTGPVNTLSLDSSKKTHTRHEDSATI